MLSKVRRLRIVRVEWEDITSRDGWIDADGQEDKDPHAQTAKCVDVGYFVKRTKKYLYVAQTRTTGEKDLEWNSIDIIPIGCVRKIETIRYENEAGES